MYFKTNDIIGKLEDYFEEERLYGKPYVHKKTAWCVYKHTIIAQSERLDKLFDEIIDVSYDYEKPEAFVLDTKKDLEGYLKRGDRIFGAIYSMGKKGAPSLISVAELTPKGWELL